PSFLLAIAPGDRAVGLAYVDVSTGEFRMTEVEDADALFDETARIEPREVLVARGPDPAWLEGWARRFPRPVVQRVDLDSFDRAGAVALLERRFGGTAAYAGDHPEAVRAPGAVL